jgi:uncharacterized protein (TIGR02246 family)
VIDARIAAGSPRIREVTLMKLLVAVLVIAAGCGQEASRAAGADSAGVDALNARLIQAYRDHDPAAYGRLFTDSAAFEWPAFNTVRGRSALEAMARASWATLQEMDLRLDVANRRVTGGHATEFGAFQQSWRDTSGGRMVEYGRYAAALTRQSDGRWLIDRFFGFADSTRRAPSSQRR